MVVLLAALFSYFCALEAATRVAFPRINHIWRTIQADHLTAVSLRQDAAGKSATMLIVGNSYLEVGVDRQNLQKEIAPNYSVAYLPISGTSYLDWYFGLRRLFAEGSRPTVVGVCLLIPPTRDVNDASNELKAAASKEGLLVVLPFQHAELPENAFLDGAHLNAKGAALFTERLGLTLLQSLYRN